jgi:hypothetical protein
VSAPARQADEDAADTTPLPVILPKVAERPAEPPAATALPGAATLPGATAIPRPAQVDRPRGPFEAAQPARPISITGSVEPPPPVAADPATPPGREIRAAASAKLEQIKDLYLTAEAIGEDALDKHFGQVSQRQRKLISEFFDRSAGDGDR